MHRVSSPQTCWLGHYWLAGGYTRDAKLLPNTVLRIEGGAFRWREGKASKEEDREKKNALLAAVRAQLERHSYDDSEVKQVLCVARWRLSAQNA